MTKICFSFATLRARIRLKTITDVVAAEEASHIESRMTQWLMGALASDIAWHYSEVIVSDSPHVWNGKIHRYNSAHAFGAWMAFRSISIILTRTQELLHRNIRISVAERELQTRYFEARRRQMVDEICEAVPTVLNHADPTNNSSSVLISAYSAIWPLYLAGTCALERVGNQTLRSTQCDVSSRASIHRTSAASAQAAWTLGRLQHIATQVGLKWASVIAKLLKDSSQAYIIQTLK